MTGKQILLDFIKQRRASYIAGTIILILTSTIASTLPKILGIITDGLSKKNMPTSSIYMYTILMVAVSLAVFAMRFLWRYLLIGNCRNVECYLRDKLFQHLQTLPVSFYNNNKTGDLVAHAINDIQAVRMMFGFGFVAILEGVMLNSLSIFFMARTINPVLTLMALGPVPLVVFVMTALRKSIRQRFEKVQEAFAAISEKVQEDLMGIRVIKAFAKEEEEIESFIKYSQARVDTHMKLTRVSAFLAPSAQICFAASFLLFIVFGSELVIKGIISIGDYVAFNSYMAVIMGPIINISRIIEIWQRGIASFKRLDRIFRMKSDIESVEESTGEYIGECGECNSSEQAGILGSIEIKNLNFTYPGAKTKALKNINIKLEQGKILGILGRTGSGKTTLVNLLLRLYPVKRGCIFIGGKDINDIPVEVLRENIGYVPQDNFLFSTTIRNNIEFFRPIYSDDEIEHAAKISAVYDNILAFPDGFDTVVGERGTTLSGGQKQRISIARAVIKNPCILIFDDSFSSVDTRTEKEILGNIRNFLQNRTGIIITHRISTIEYADEIIFMDNGKITERGTHEELLAKKGSYYSLYMTQTLTAGIEEENAG